jgi:hypothetical protein
MMVSKKSLFFAGATMLCMSTAFAQNAQSKKVSRVSNKVMNTASLDLQTGVITRGPSIKQKAAGPTATVTTVNNLDFAGFIGIDSGTSAANGPCEWFSGVQKGTGATGGESTYMTSYLFAYCSVAKDVASGGTGTTATMNFWDGFSNGVGATAGSTGTNLISVTVTGLPGNTGLAGWLTGGFAACVAFLFNIGLTGGPAPIVVPDSNIAVSFLFEGVDANGTLGTTATFLSCVASCSGLGPDGFAMVDRIDNYCGGNFLTSFSFGTSLGVSFSSVAFSIRELCGIDASDAVQSLNGLGINTQVLTIPDAPELGGTFAASIDCTGFAAGGVLFRLAFFPTGVNPILGGTKGQLLVQLISGAGISGFAGAHGGAPKAIPFGGVPLLLQFYGFQPDVQAFCGTGGNPTPPGKTNLSNLCRVTVGSQE